MKIENLVTFSRVAREHSYTRAADSLFLTPSAVHQQVKQLETEVQARLVYVVGKEVRLTAEGTRVYLAAQEIEAVHRLLLQDLETTRERAAHVVRLGASSYFGVMAQAAEAVKQRFPDVTVEFETMRPWDAADEIRAGTIDFGFVGAMHVPSDLEADPCVRNRIVIVAPSDHPLAHLSTVTFEDVQKYPMAGYQEGSARRAIDRWAASRSGVRIRYAAQIISSVDIKTTALLMNTPAFTIESAVTAEVDADALRVLNVVDFEASYVLFAVHRRNLRSRAASAYLTELQQLFIADAAREPGASPWASS